MILKRIMCLNVMDSELSDFIGYKNFSWNVEMCNEKFAGPCNPKNFKSE